MHLSFNKKDLADSLEHGICMSILWLAKVLAWIIVFTAAINFTPWWRDATDEPDWFGTRSGMGLHTDRETGCQYLSRDGLIPRVDDTGRHMGCYQTSE